MTEKVGYVHFFMPARQCRPDNAVGILIRSHQARPGNSIEGEHLIGQRIFERLITF